MPNTPCKLNHLCLAALLSVAGTVGAEDRFYPLITYQCDPDADILTITNSVLKGDEGANFEYSADDGTYTPWDMVEIARNTDSTRIIKSTKVSRHCKLSSAAYNVVLEPHIFSTDLEGQCGDIISGAVTISAGENELLARTAFEDYCLGEAPIITRITVFGKTGQYKIKRIAKYEFY